MRKKYLSALLFGALLFASAGTFTSCKDYDDDINNLQEQINTVVSDLASLKTTVESLGGYVTDVKVEDGKLVVTANGSTVSYDLPAGTSSEVANIEIKGGHLYVNNEDKGSVGNTVTVNEDGELLIDGNASGLKVGSEVIIKDSSNGMYTISIDGQTIQLPMASANITIEAGNIKVFANIGDDNFNDFGGAILWGTASKDVEWDGPKGDVKKDQLLVGQINLVDVDVLPATFDLSTVDLELVDTEGNPAPVKVTAKPADSEDALTGGNSRTTDKSGKWNLSIEMKSDVTSSNIATSFATGKTTDDKNYLYAIKANGVIVSDYVFAIDTDVQKTTTSLSTVNASDCTFGDVAMSWNQVTSVPLGTSEVKYKNDKAYDYYVTFAGKDINDAEYKGVTIKDNVITASDAAAGQEIAFDLHVLDITGKVIDFEKRFTVKFEGSTTEATELATVNHIASPTFAADGLVIDLGTTFSGLTAEEATLVSGVKWTTEDGEFIFAAKNLANKDYELKAVTIKYYKDAECKQEVVVTNWDEVSNIKEIKYAKITGTYNTDAEVGTHNATLTLYKTNNSVDSELKKITVPVNVTLPKFEDICIKSATWTKDKEEANFRLTQDGKLSIMTAYKLADKVTVGSSTNDNNLVVEFDKIELENGTQVSPIGTYSSAAENDQNVVTITNTSKSNEVSVNAYALDEDNMLTELSAVSKFVIAGVEGFTVESPKYSVKLTTILDGTMLVYLDSDKKEATLSVNGTSGVFTSLTSANGPAAAAANVICLKFDNEYYQLNGNNLLDGNTIKGDSWSFEFDANAGEDVSATYDKETKKLTINNLPSKGADYTVAMTPVYEGAVVLDNNSTGVEVVTKLPAVTINVVQSNQ